MKSLNSKFNLIRLFDRLTVMTFITLLIAISLLLLMLGLYSQLQTSHGSETGELLEKVDELQQTADDLVDNLEQFPNSDPTVAEELDNLETQLDEIGEGLETLEDSIEEIGMVIDSSESNNRAVPQNTDHVHQSINQILSLITYLISGLSIITALILLKATSSNRRGHLSARLRNSKNT